MSSQTTIPGISIEQYSERALAVFITDKNVKPNYHIFLTACLNGKHNPCLRGATPDGPKREGYIFGLKQKAQIVKQLSAEYERIRDGGRPISILPVTSTDATNNDCLPTSSSDVPHNVPSTYLSSKYTSTSTSSQSNEVKALVSRVEALEAEVLAIRALLQNNSQNTSNFASLSISSGTKEKSTKRAKIQVSVSSDDDEYEDEQDDTPPPSLIKRKPMRS